MRGIPYKVSEWDGFTVKIKYNQIYLIDIFNSWKVLENLLKNIGLEKPHTRAIQPATKSVAAYLFVMPNLFNFESIYERTD